MKLSAFGIGYAIGMLIVAAIGMTAHSPKPSQTAGTANNGLLVGP